MKKLAFIIALCAQQALFALPMGNPWQASLFCDGEGIVTSECPSSRIGDKCWWVKLSFGYYGDYVYDRYLETDSPSNSDLKFVSLYTNAGSVTANICDWADVFATFGATSGKFVGNSSTFQNSNAINSPIHVQLAADFSWSVGARTTAWRCGNFALGLEGQYFHTSPEITSAYDISASSLQTYFSNLNFNYSEWQVGMGATYQICLSQSIQALPYVGVTWSRATVDLDDAGFSILEIGEGGAQSAVYTATFLDLHSQKIWGFVTGVTFVGCERFSVGVEGRFASEAALYVNSSIRF